MSYEEKTISSKVVYEGPVFRVRQHVVDTIGGNSIRDIVEHTGGAIMVAVRDDGRILVEKQYRKALESDFLELPAGKADPGEAPEVTASRELAEETVCKDLTRGEKHLDRDECIDLEWYDPEELINLIMKGDIQDSKTIIGILFARQAGEI